MYLYHCNKEMVVDIPHIQIFRIHIKVFAASIMAGEKMINSSAFDCSSAVLQLIREIQVLVGQIVQCSRNRFETVFLAAFAVEIA